MMHVYSVYDSAIGKFSVPMIYDTNLAAMRAVVTAFASSPTATVFPDDYAVVCLGDFDLQDGVFSFTGDNVGWRATLSECIKLLKPELLDGTDKVMSNEV